jgi:yecA family protein
MTACPARSAACRTRLHPPYWVRPPYPSADVDVKLGSMNTHLTQAEFTQLDASLLGTINLSMLDGYLAAVASGPNFAMPDQVLRWVLEAGSSDALATSLIIGHYQAVNHALNNQIYVPQIADPQAWCRGFLAGFAADMTAWAPLTAAQPELLKGIISGAAEADLTDAARRIHAFWVAKRRQSTGLDLLAQLAALAPGHTVRSTQLLH